MNSGLEEKMEAGNSEQVTARVQAEDGEMAIEMERTKQRPRTKGGSHEF